jgi:hypothetical protein
VGILATQHLHSFGEAQDVKLADSECAITTLDTARPADQPRAGTTRGIG